MKITRVSVDERRREYSVTLENGETYDGIKAFRNIRLNRVRDDAPDDKPWQNLEVTWETSEERKMRREAFE